MHFGALADTRVVADGQPPARPKMAVPHAVQLGFPGANHPEQSPSLPPRVESGENGLVEDDRGPGTEGPDENGLDRQVTMGLQEQPHHLVRLVSPPSIGNGQGRLPKLADRQDPQPTRRQGPPVDEAKRHAGAKQAGNNAARQQKQKIAGKRMPAPARRSKPDDE